MFLNRAKKSVKNVRNVKLEKIKQNQPLSEKTRIKKRKKQIK